MLDVLSFGCRLNHAESQTIRRRASEAGLADALVVNSCGVTAEAVRQVRQSIRAAKRANPTRTVILTGCAAETDRGSFLAMPEVDRIVPNARKLETTSYRQGSAPGAVEDGPAADWAAPTPDQGGWVRAFVEVQNGCDHTCTFCVIPVGRGRSRSRPASAVIDDVRRLAVAGYPEIVLTGVDLTAWGSDFGAELRLGGLVRAVLTAVPEVVRLRLSSVDPVEVDSDLLAAFADEERLMPHLHLSLQHGDDLILRRMRRRHRRADALALTDRLRRLRPDMVFGADVIAGFPTETEDMFRNTLTIVEDCDLSFLHVFPYSQRPGTAAARMPQVERTVAKQRAAELRECGERALMAQLDRECGQLRGVLVERANRGRSEQFFRVELGAEAPVGSVVRARISGRQGMRLTAMAA
ncbi:MAG: tRNA (N(6)-L-threonylcarbamoyladenosine(37)-C(2))-methylthiotransferase MtaB [Bauldia sp.]